VSNWTFPSSWDTIPNVGTVFNAILGCTPPTVPLALVPPISGPATLTH
jgi:hypothetical protein